MSIYFLSLLRSFLCLLLYLCYLYGNAFLSCLRRPLFFFLFSCCPCFSGNEECSENRHKGAEKQGETRRERPDTLIPLVNKTKSLINQLRGIFSLCLLWFATLICHQERKKQINFFGTLGMHCLFLFILLFFSSLHCFFRFKTPCLAFGPQTNTLPVFLVSLPAAPPSRPIASSKQRSATPSPTLTQLSHPHQRSLITTSRPRASSSLPTTTITPTPTRLRRGASPSSPSPSRAPTKPASDPLPHSSPP